VRVSTEAGPTQRSFDRKFGADFLAKLPLGPGVYLFQDAAEVVIYVGKAKSLRRRLRNYRNASRRRVHKKMRTLVRAASSVRFEELSTERSALLRENELIQKLRPRYNVDGAFAFLYPAIGMGCSPRRLMLCFSTQPALYAELGLTWYGSFRSRPRVKASFDALIDLLSLIGHREKRAALPAYPSVRGSRLVALRQVPAELGAALPAFFAGQEQRVLGQLAQLLLAKPRALRDASQVQEQLQTLKHFFEVDAKRLRQALGQLERVGCFVAQGERDALFIESAFLAGAPRDA
jgi:GIY-YIG catalytic domain-containing protein